MSHNTVYVLCFWRRYIPIWFPLALQVQFILSLHWRPPYCQTVTAVQDRIPLSTVPVPALLQSSLGATAWRDFAEGSWMLPPSFGLGPGKWNLEASFPPSVQWFAQTDIPKFYNWLSLDGFFWDQCWSDSWTFAVRLQSSVSKDEALVSQSSSMKMYSGTIYHGLILS